MFSYLKNTLARNIKNSFGWSTDRKIVVFTVDDYGSVRMASKAARENLRTRGLKIDNSKFDMFDALEDADDLVQLFDSLTSVKDKTNRSAAFTAMSLPANPNFNRMLEEGYEKYHFEL